MSLSNENGMVLPVQPMGYGYGGGYGGGFGFGGWDSSIWLILIVLFAMGGFGGFGMGGFGGMGFDFPWLLNGQNGINANTNAGFQNLATQNQISSLQNSVTTGFSNAEVAACNRAMTDQALSFNNQIADLNRSFDAQTAVTAGQNAIQSQLADCCCENRLATANLQSVIQSENCADRAAVTDGVRDILEATQAQNQRIIDKLCDQELQAERRENQELRSRINMLDLAASQAQQTAALVADNTAQTQYIVNRVAPYPQPAYVVGFGNNGWNNGWNGGCGWNGGFGFNNGFGF